MIEMRTNPNAVIAAFIGLFKNDALVESLFSKMQ